MAVPREDRAGERVGRGPVEGLDRLLELVVGVDVDGQYRREDLLFHGDEVGIGGEDDGGLDEVAGALVSVAAREDPGVRGPPGGLDVGHGGVEGGLVDDGVHEVPEVAHVAHADLPHHAQDEVLQLGPGGLRRVDAGAGGTLLALVLEGPAHDGGGGVRQVGGLVDEDVVLAPRFADEPRIDDVAAQVLAHRLPHAVEDPRGAGEVDAREARVVQDDPAHERAAPRDEVDDAVREAGLLVDLHQVVVGEDGGGGRLPDDGVAHEGGRRGQVGGDGREVEGRDREDEAFQGPVVHPVPGVGGGKGLVRVDLLHELHVVAEEVRRLAGGVDLRLEGVLGLPQHGGGVHPEPVAVRDEAGDLVEDGGAVLPGHALPGLLRPERRVDGQAHLRLASLVIVPEHVRVVVGAGHPPQPAGADLLAADDERDLDLLAVLPLQLGLQEGALRGARGVGMGGLVVGVRDLEEAVGHVLLLWDGPYLSVDRPRLPGRTARRAGRAPALPETARNLEEDGRGRTDLAFRPAHASRSRAGVFESDVLTRIHRSARPEFGSSAVE